MLLPIASRAADIPKDLPPVTREFRGLWVATVGNIDWPTKGASTDQQKQELIAILDKAAALRMNAVVFQVRPAADALYPSDLEPWSAYLTGTMGKAPEPFYDPLAFAIEECHKRGLELHAWFNPFRASYAPGSTPAPSHISVTRAQLVKPYGRQQWMDPGEPDARKHSLAVFLDVVKRYDIDGIHVDDYFYPYKVRGPQGGSLDFPDNSSWAKYRADGGRLSRADWRRDSINQFIEGMYKGTKELKPWVKVGVSPFGIWRPKNPPGISGFDAYAELYADSRKWLQNGWVDYFTPQLYWSSTKPRQSYPALLAWWVEQNRKHRNIWPGNILSHPADEIGRQIEITRKQNGATGNVFFSARTLLTNRGGVADTIAKAYAEPSLVPPSPWLEARGPEPPTLTVEAGVASWKSEGPGWLWVIRSKTNGTWTTEIVPAGQTTLPVGGAEIYTVTAVDRCGLASEPSVWERPLQEVAVKATEQHVE
jgi:uncharacterized lipoprotein YddW (UPF0748 family)